MAGSDECGHVKNGSDLGTPTPNMALATKLAAVVIEWSYSGERSGLCVGKGAEFGHEAQEGGCGDLADALDLLKAGQRGQGLIIDIISVIVTLFANSFGLFSPV